MQFICCYIYLNVLCIILYIMCLAYTGLLFLCFSSPVSVFYLLRNLFLSVSILVTSVLFWK